MSSQFDAFLAEIPPAFHWPLQFCAFVTATAYIFSLITSNASQVDRVWTFLPTIYSAYFALLPLWPNEQIIPLLPYTPAAMKWVAKDFSPRALLMFGITVIWMFRLSYNTYRRGLFNPKEEDYRWVVLRSQIHPILFQVVNLTFISIIQNLLLLSLGIPTYVAAVLQYRAPLETSDYLLATAAIVDLLIEFTADNQQFSFHAYKHAYLARSDKAESTHVAPYNSAQQWPGARLDWVPEDAKRGFVTKGLWAYSRHPNFLCEQTFWWLVTFFPFLASAPPSLPWVSSFSSLQAIINGFPSSLIPMSQPFVYLSPAISLSLLFFSSTLFTEAITASKYPAAYRAYQKRVGMFSPLRTLEKGLVLWARGAKEEADTLIWGDGKREKVE